MGWSRGSGNLNSHTSDFATHPRRCRPDLGRQLTLGSVDLSALIFVALAVAWAVYRSLEQPEAPPVTTPDPELVTAGR